MRGATPFVLWLSLPQKISIHTPHAGSDIKLMLSAPLMVISIHTPHAGSDGFSFRALMIRWHFNPHSPCGERPRCQLHRLLQQLFQSTLPMRGATRAPKELQNLCSISIHTPHAGSDRKQQGRTVGGMSNFNPHSPCGERPALENDKQYLEQISIHTPHAGSDFYKKSRIFRSNKFQSTLPMRGATFWSLYFFCNSSNISIHTPHAGSDSCVICHFVVPSLFQSTLPMRGATGGADLYS